MRKLIADFFCGETLRYLIFGILAVVTNIAAYHLFALVFDVLVANTLAFCFSLLFTYCTNTRFVFRTRFTKKNFLQFMSLRASTILIDNGIMLLLTSWNCNETIAKCVDNAIIIVLNYLFSKLVIFKKTPKD